MKRGTDNRLWLADTSEEPVTVTLTRGQWTSVGLGLIAGSSTIKRNPAMKSHYLSLMRQISEQVKGETE